jgi:hypothetical protein
MIAKATTAIRISTTRDQPRRVERRRARRTTGLAFQDVCLVPIPMDIGNLRSKRASPITHQWTG